MSQYRIIQKEWDEVNAKFEERIRELRKKCSHDELTGWLGGPEADVKCCRNCMQIIDTRPTEQWSVRGIK